jgi:hypothetical protein
LAASPDTPNTPQDHGAIEPKPVGGWAARLSRVLERQLELYEQLDTKSAAQSELIEGDNADQLLEVLRQRQAIVDQIIDLNAQLKPYREKWESLAESIAPQQRDDLRSRFDALGEAARRIVMRDDLARLPHEPRPQRIADELASITAGKGAVAAYSTPGAPPAPMLQDRNA